VKTFKSIPGRAYDAPPYRGGRAVEGKLK